VVAGAVVVGAVLYVGALEPALTRWRELSTLLDGRQLALERSQRLSDTAGDIESDFMLSFDLGNSVEEAVNSLMEEVRGQAGNAVRISGMRPASPSSERGFQVAKAQIEFEGTLSKAASFVYQIEKRSSGIWLERCQLAPVGKGSNLLRGTAIVCRAVAQPRGEMTR
jgi:hypothetical protein